MKDFGVYHNEKENKVKKRLTVAIFVMILMAGLAFAAIPEYIFTVDTANGGFAANIKELGKSVTGTTPEQAFDRAAIIISDHKANSELITMQIADIDAQIAELKAKKAELQAQKVLDIYALIDEKYMGKYREKLSILSGPRTGIETQFGVDAHSVLYRLAPGNIYGTPLISGWGFHKWQE